MTCLIDSNDALNALNVSISYNSVQSVWKGRTFSCESESSRSDIVSAICCVGGQLARALAVCLLNPRRPASHQILKTHVIDTQRGDQISQNLGYFGRD